MSRQGVQTTRGAYEAFARRDIAGVLDRLHDDVEWDVPESAPFGGIYHGKEEVGRFFASLPEHLEELNVEPAELHDAGDHVIVTGRHSGRARGGEPFETRFAMVWRMRDGKAAAFREYTDFVPMVRALETAAA